MQYFRSLFILLAALTTARAAEQYSGIYPHLAYFNNEDECGTGAVVPWADRLWVVTYGPHLPMGSSDKLYEITPGLEMVARAESVGGTPANRMIHAETRQLNIGPYFIDEDRTVRVIPPTRMPGRLTGTARHLTDPANKVYIATMEEGLYEVDVHTLEVKELIKDGNANEGATIREGILSELPGYHGKGLYSGQGQLIYANNGEKSTAAQRNPFIPSGALASWEGSGDWKLIRRNQFTEVSGPGGIYGNAHPDSDPLWALGWDARSIILMVLDQGKWHCYRLPKASHSYDGAHGWNTEWPRIRDIGEDDLLMTMHGMFWRFPRIFTLGKADGIAARSTFLKVTGDFCRWQDWIVLGCDDTAKREFLNTRRAKGHIKAAQSQSNLWFLEPRQLDQLGPVIGRGAVWLNDAVEANTASDPFLIDAFAKRAIHLYSDKPTTITLEIDREGNGVWQDLDSVQIEGYAWYAIDPALDAVWMRLRSSEQLGRGTAWFQLAGNDPRPVGEIPEKFAGVARVGQSQVTGGLLRARADNTRTLEFAAEAAGKPLGHYSLDGAMRLSNDHAMDAFEALQENAAIPSREGVISVDEASVLYIDDKGRRFRLPGNPSFEKVDHDQPRRLCREIITERDLFNCEGTFYELPAKNAGGFNRVRPVSSHNLDIRDYCSYRGLFVISGVSQDRTMDTPHIIRSEDGNTALWAGAIDDLWSLGKPVGVGGPWKKTEVHADVPSDPYLMTGYDRKALTICSEKTATITAEIDVTGLGDWYPYRTFTLSPSESVEYVFPDAFQAYWIRFRSDRDTTATAILTYQ